MTERRKYTPEDGNTHPKTGISTLRVWEAHPLVLSHFEQKLDQKVQKQCRINNIPDNPEVLGGLPWPPKPHLSCQNGQKEEKLGGSNSWPTVKRVVGEARLSAPVTLISHTFINFIHRYSRCFDQNVHRYSPLFRNIRPWTGLSSPTVKRVHGRIHPEVHG